MNFIKQFLILKKKKQQKKRHIVQCTGLTYKLGEESKYWDIKKKRKKISEMIKNIYEIKGRDSFINTLLLETGWDGSNDNLNDNIKKEINKRYSDRTIIIDEVHNRVAKAETEGKFPSIIETVIENSDNIRLILMSATPMVNKPTDIMHPINLLRIKPSRQQMSHHKITRNAYIKKMFMVQLMFPNL